MSATAIAVIQSDHQLARQEWEREENLKLIRNTVAPGLSEPEFQLFCHVARVRHLDPLQRQIHAVKRRSWNPDIGERGGFEEKMTIQTGIDGFRAIANRTGLYMPSDKLPLVEGAGTENLRVTVWVKKFHPASNQWHEFGATAYYREFVQTKKGDGGKRVAVAMWEKMPVGQTEKCAEAKALRRGWPEELGQLYADEEMQQADTPTVLPPESGPKKQDKTQRELGTLKPSTEPNRGHGDEGLAPAAQGEDVVCAECRVTNGHADKCPNNPAKKSRKREKAEPTTIDGRTSAQKSEDKWLAKEGHDPKVHISRSQAGLLFATMKNMNIPDTKYREILTRVCEVEHTHLIPKAKFGELLDAVDPAFKFHEAPEPF